MQTLSKGYGTHQIFYSVYVANNPFFKIIHINDLAWGGAQKEKQKQIFDPELDKINKFQDSTIVHFGR